MRTSEAKRERTERTGGDRNDRGEYRAIRRVLLDGPDFQQLSERARFVFIAVKLNAGPVGLETEYESAAVEKLAMQTGMPPRAVKKALKELEQHHWIDREGNVFCIVGHLDNEPSISSNDIKHRKSVHRYLAGLPRLDIVRRFIGSHASWFPKEEMRENGLAWAIQGPSVGASEGASESLASTEDRRLKTEDREPKTDPIRPPSDFSVEAAQLLDVIHRRLPADEDRLALNTLIAAVAEPRTWLAEINASLDGMSGHAACTPEQAGRALRDFVRKGKAVKPELGYFRGYLTNAAKWNSRSASKPIESDAQAATSPYAEALGR